MPEWTRSKGAVEHKVIGDAAVDMEHKPLLTRPLLFT